MRPRADEVAAPAALYADPAAPALLETVAVEKMPDGVRARRALIPFSLKTC